MKLSKNYSIAVLSIGLMLCSSICHAASDEHPSNKWPVNYAPTAVLHYSIKADRSGLTLVGDATVNWQINTDKNAPKYSVDTETRAAIVGRILQASSHGTMDNFGLAPLQYEEKPRNKPGTQTRFDRSASLIKFSESNATYPLLGGEQDRTGVIWQLISIARANPKKFTPKSEWNFFVAGRRDAERWTFTVTENVTLNTPLGNFETVHIVKAPPPDSKDQQLDIWLAPSLEWYPVRLKFSDADGDTIDQRLDKIDKGTNAGS